SRFQLVGIRLLALRIPLKSPLEDASVSAHCLVVTSGSSMYEFGLVHRGHAAGGSKCLGHSHLLIAVVNGYMARLAALRIHVDVVWFLLRGLLAHQVITGGGHQHTTYDQNSAGPLQEL